MVLTFPRTQVTWNLNPLLPWPSFFFTICLLYCDFPGGSDGKASAYNAGDPGSIPWSGRSPGEGNGNPLQYSCLGNAMDGGAWWAIVSLWGCKESDTTERLHFHFTLLYIIEQHHRAYHDLHIIYCKSIYIIDLFDHLNKLSLYKNCENSIKKF